MTRGERLRTVVTDGPLTAPVWLQHVVKVATSCAIAWLVYGVLGGLVDEWYIDASRAGLVGGYGFFILLRLVYTLRPSLSGDATVYGWKDRAADWACDFALASVAISAGFAAESRHVTAAVQLALAAVVYWFTLLRARP